ncbi:hypothetical protein OAL15_02395 [Flavobacteriales bacterium]|nr:hypothetical protein [Flavobacteriales bacterium]
MGVILWADQSYSDSVIQIGVKQMLNASEVLTAQVHWNPMDSLFIENINWIASLASEHNRDLIINMDWLTDDRKSKRGNGWSFNEEHSRTNFIIDAFTACKKYNPKYINLGVEVNFLALANPNEFKAFLDVYNYTKKLLNDSFPNTQVSASLQLELLYGKLGGWDEKTSVEVLEAFGENYDVLSISTYPHEADTKSSDSLINDLLTRTIKPIGIFETSFPTDKYSYKEQEEYLVHVLSKLNESKRCKLLIWTSIHDTETVLKDNHWSGHLGLFSSKFKPKNSWETWNEWLQHPITD